MELRRINLSQIQNEITVCPYCGDEKNCESYGCCGESSAHFQRAYELADETVLVDECEVVDDRSMGERVLEFFQEHKARLESICRCSPANPTLLEKYSFRAKRIFGGLHKVQFYKTRF